MTYREAQAILEKAHLAKHITMIERMVYQGVVWDTDSFSYFRSWDDEISEEDREKLNRHYGYFNLEF